MQWRNLHATATLLGRSLPWFLGTAVLGCSPRLAFSSSSPRCRRVFRGWLPINRARRFLPRTVTAKNIDTGISRTATTDQGWAISDYLRCLWACTRFGSRRMDLRRESGLAFAWPSGKRRQSMSACTGASERADQSGRGCAGGERDDAGHLRAGGREASEGSAAERAQL